MKKIGVSLAVVFWMTLAMRYLFTGKIEAKNIVSVFNSEKYYKTTAKVVGYGNYDVILKDSSRDYFVKSLASSLGLNCSEDVIQEKKEEKTSYKYEKKSQNGKATVEYVTTKNEAHVGVIIDLLENVDAAEDYEELISNIFKAEGIEGTVSIYYEGRISGALNYEEKNRLANGIMNTLKAKSVMENRGSDIFTLYGYSEYIEKYITSVGKRVNINITIYYDEINNETVICVATPLNNLDY